MASCDSTWWPQPSLSTLTSTKESTGGTGRATSTSRSKRATVKRVCALHALLTCVRVRGPSSAKIRVIGFGAGPTGHHGLVVEPRGKHVSMVTGPAGQQKPLSFYNGASPAIGYHCLFHWNRIKGSGIVACAKQLIIKGTMQKADLFCKQQLKVSTAMLCGFVTLDWTWRPTG